MKKVKKEKEREEHKELTEKRKVEKKKGLTFSKLLALLIKKNEQKKLPRVRGKRICHVCKGFCVGESWRTDCGQRRMYFDSENCLRRYIQQKINELTKKEFRGSEISDEVYKGIRDDFYEKVFVIMPKSKGGN